MNASDIHILSQLRTHDRMRYLASLLVDEEYRVAFTTLYAFNAEISRIRSQVKEPLPGEIRLQWWRDVTAGNARKDEAAANPLANSLNEVIDRYGLDRASFDGYCSARIFDLYDDPMPDKQTYEGYSGETNSMLLQWCCQIIDGDMARQSSDISGHAGVAQTVALNLTQLANHSTRGQVYIPLEIIKAHGLDRDEFLKREKISEIDDVIRDFATYGADHLDKARSAAAQLPENFYQAFTSVALCERIFKRSHRYGAKCLRTSPAPASWVGQWDLWRGARKGIF